MKKYCQWIVLWTAAAVFCGVPDVSGAGPEKKKNAEQESFLVPDNAYTAMTDFLAVLATIHANYVDRNKAEWENLFRAAIRGVMRELDPFSHYEAPEDFKATKEDISGSKVGIGVVISIRVRGLEIMSVLPESPAQESGLKSGDVILEIDGEDASGLNLNEAVSRIRGDEDSELRLLIYRASGDARKEIRVKRKQIKIGTIPCAKILPGTDGTAYMRLLQFSGSTVEDFNKVMAKLKKEGMTALVLDLRDNPGGLVAAVVPLCSHFLPAGKNIVSIEGRNNRKEILVSGSKDEKDLDLPLVVLINGNSASAAEIFAACMRDYKRAVLVGEQTFGKGSVQTIIPFREGGKESALRLTTALYFTPGRHKIHGNGITPDIVIPLSPAQRSHLSAQLNRYPGEILPLAPSPIRDTALERSLEILKGMRIFRNVHTNNHTQKGINQ